MSSSSSAGQHPRTTGTKPPTSTSRRLVVLAPAAALVLVALCLRGPFSAVGPVAGDLRAEFALSTATLGVLTALPLVCFGLVSPFAPALAARLGVHRAVLAAAVVLSLGVAVRLGGTPGLFIGTVLLTGGIAVCNVLLPAVARAEYAERAPTVIGVVTCSMALSAAIGAGLAQPLASAAGSARTGLALWLVLTLIAAAAIAVLARSRPHAAAPAQPVRRAILRDRVALLVTLFFGLQSLTFYAMLAWLPDVLQTEAGISPVAAGGLLALATGLGAPASLVVPTLAARRPHQGRWVLLAGALIAAALTGLLVAPAAAPVLWTLLYGLGTGVAFPLALTLVLLRTRDVAQTGRLSAAAQSTGYLLAATGPLSVGLLHDLTDGWSLGLALLLVLAVAQTAVGLAAARPRLVTERVVAEPPVP
ncbi:MAG TPA: MFS transporter [Modestobacter sp.]|nr:MFS transporter [Modestobacter sp.]